jgi:hypothetical protein
VTSDPVFARVQAIVGRVAGPERMPATVGESTPLGDGGFWLDSIELLDVLIACDDALGPFSPSLAEVDGVLDTIGTLAAAIHRSRVAGPAA